jgi:hypothetical protein
VLENFVQTSQAYGNGWPVIAVMGGGLRGVRLGIGRHQITSPIHVDEREVRSDLSSGAPSAIEHAGAWADELYDIAGVRELDREGR